MNAIAVYPPASTELMLHTLIDCEWNFGKRAVLKRIAASMPLPDRLPFPTSSSIHFLVRLLIFIKSLRCTMSATTAMPLLLLVEDEAILRLDIEGLLEDAGFALISLHNATTAIGEIEKDCSRFGGLVTDIDLGNGPSGWDIARRARELSPALPVVYMSGASAADWTAQGVPKSVMLAKPFAPAQLITAISTLMNEAPPTGES